MLVLLPPSEAKARGGGGPPLNLLALTFPELRARRERLAVALVELAADLPAARAALKVSAAQDDRIAATRALRSAGTMPAMDRYTGVLYDALDTTKMTAAERSRAGRRILIGSALLGAVGGSDLIPEYRLSAGSQLPGIGPIASFWKPALTPMLAALGEPVLDLRSGAYAAFAPLPEAITVRVMTEQPDGTRTVVSHFNKATKGRLARIVATSRAEFDAVDKVIAAARRAGMRIERTGPRALQVIT